MVLGLLRRLLGRATVNRGVDNGKERVDPRGRWNGRCYEPAPEELEEAVPITPMFDWEDPREVLSEEELGLALLSSETWRPRGRGGARVLCREVRLEGYMIPFTVMAWSPEGRVYLMDDASYLLFYFSEGDRTAREIVEEVISRFLEKASDNYPIKRAFMKDDSEKTEEDRELVHGFIAAHYAQLYLLKKHGLIE